jgi:ESCRT-II complex subunit VPS22
MREQLVVFKEKLEQFGIKHKKDINRDPVLRRRFLEMCKSIGVDPLMSNRGFWVQILGVGDFYYEVAVQVIDVCLRTRRTNGGLIELVSLCNHLNSIRPKSSQAVTPDDVMRSIDKIKVLGSGFSVQVMGVPPNECKMVQSVPLELNRDHSTILQEARESGCITKAVLVSRLKWDSQRCDVALEYLEQQGMAWIDDKAKDGQRCWYFPSLKQEWMAA